MTEQLLRSSEGERRLQRSVEELCARAFTRVDIAWLAYFRVAFGTLMLYEMWRFWEADWVGRNLVEPSFHFTYVGFEWVRPLSEHSMRLVVPALGLCAALIALGLVYRLAALSFFVGFSFLFLLEKGRYLNHFYLIGLVGFLLVFMPADRAFSLRTWRRPRQAWSTVPAWMLLLLRTQIGIVYVYGGIAKLNGDWLRGQPLGIWLAERPDLPVIGRFANEPWLAWFMSYAGLAFDLLIVPMLLVRRTRAVALLACLVFHVTNAELFRIGVFPWFMLAATLLFCPPTWPRRIWPRAFGSAVETVRPATASPAALSLVAGYVVIQGLLPLRHWLYPGVTAWTQEAERFSWRMRLNHSRGVVTFYAIDGTGYRMTIHPREFLTARQVLDMGAQPDMILQAAHVIAKRLREQGHGEVQVRCVAHASLNGRPPQLLIDPSVDLVAEPLSLRPARFILPFVGGSPPVPGDPAFSFDASSKSTSSRTAFFAPPPSPRDVRLGSPRGASEP
jgi:vitamin K-dependent gamma-carboxylase